MIRMAVGKPLEDWRVFPYHIAGLPEDNVDASYFGSLSEKLLRSEEFVIDRSDPSPSLNGPVIYV